MYDRLPATRRAIVVGSLLGLYICAQPAAALAQGLACPAGTGIQVQNLDSGPAAINISFFNADGTLAGSESVSIPSNAGATFQAPGGSFMGSCVVSSDVPQVVAVANLQAAGGGTAYGYSDFAEAAASFQVALPLQSGGFRFSSSLYIQNPGPPADVLMGFTDANGTFLGTHGAAIPSNGTARRDSDDFGLVGTSPFTSDVFPATSTPVVAIINDIGNGDDHAYFPASSHPSDRLLLPLCRRNDAVSAQVMVQNVAFVEQETTITYYDTKGRRRGSNDLILGPRQLTTVGCPGPNDFDGSAVIESNGSLVAVTQLDAFDPGGRSAEEFSTAIPGLAPEQLSKDPSWIIGPDDDRRTALTYRAVNAGKGKATVTVTMRDGEGNVLISRNLKIKRNGSAELTFPAANVTGAFSIETRVKRKGPVAPLALEERESGEINFVPALRPPGD